MAATADKYSIDTLNDQDNGNTKQIYALQPLALKNYRVNPDAPNPDQTYAQDEEHFKTLFYVHDTWHKQDSEGKECVIGLMNPNYSGDEFYKHHAADRFGKLRLKKKVNGTWIDFIVLNDGGLNTLAYARFGSKTHSEDKDPIAAYTNYIKMPLYLKSAYYLQTDMFTLVFETKNSQNQWVETYSHPVPITSNSTILAAGRELDYIYSERNVNLGPENTWCRLKILAENDEGTYTSGYSNEFKLKGAMNFIKVYKFQIGSGGGPREIPDTGPTSDIDPTTGDPYAMVISEDMYDPITQGDPRGGVITRTIAAGDTPMIDVQEDEKLQGTDIVQDVSEAYDGEIGQLPYSYYFGVPTTYGGDTLGWIKVRQAPNTGTYQLYWYGNTYVETSFDLNMEVGVKYDETYYYVTVTAKVSGTLRSGVYPSVTTDLLGTMPRPGRNPEVAMTFSGTMSNSREFYLTPTSGADTSTLGHVCWKVSKSSEAGQLIAHSALTYQTAVSPDSNTTYEASITSQDYQDISRI